MKKLMFLGIVILGSSMMSFTVNSKEELVVGKFPIITHTCPNGYQFDYFDDPALTPEDHTDIQNTVCNDPANTIETGA